MEWNYHKMLAQTIFEKYENDHVKVVEISSDRGKIDVETMKELEKLRSKNG